MTVVATEVPSQCPHAAPSHRTDTGSSDLDASGVYDENGVDRSLIRSSLRRTPTECLDTLEDMLQLAESARCVD